MTFVSQFMRLFLVSLALFEMRFATSLEAGREVIASRPVSDQLWRIGNVALARR
jgi:hypothetical protein